MKLMLARLTDAMQTVKLLKATAREDAVGPLLEGDTQRLNRALRRRVFSKEALIALQEPILVLFATGYLYVAVARWKMPIGSVLVLIFLFVQVIRGLNKIQRKYQLMVSEGSALWSIREHDRPAPTRRRSRRAGPRCPRSSTGSRSSTSRSTTADRACSRT